MADHQALITGPQTVKHEGKEKSVRHMHMRNTITVTLCAHKQE